MLLAVASCGDDTGPSEMGSIRVEVYTNQPELAPDGYAISVDGEAAGTIGASGSVTFSARSSGNHAVELEGLDWRCAVSGENPRTVSVSAGNVAIALFVVECSYIGDLEVETRTTGPSPLSFEFSVDDGEPQSIGKDQIVKIRGLTVGDHWVQLAIPSTCSMSYYGDEPYPNPVHVHIPPSGAAVAYFDVTCTASIEVKTVTTGVSPDLDGYVVLVDGETRHSINANDTVTITDFGLGVHSVELTDLAPNCDVLGDNPGSLEVVDAEVGETINIQFDVVCSEVQPLSQQMVYTSARQEVGEAIYVMDEDGSNARALTSPAEASGWLSEPAISPDGTRVAFAVDYYGFSGDIWTVKYDGTGLRNLDGEQGGHDRMPSWSPDGSRILFASTRDGDYDIYVMNADGSDVTRLTDQAGSDFYPSWSPDGNQIAFATNRENGDHEIYVMDADGSGQARLTNQPGWDASPSWSPDGSRILFVTNRGGDYEVYSMNSDGSEPVNLTNSPTREESAPSWSPDGNRIVFARRGEGGDFEVYVMEADGSGQTDLTNSPDSNDVPGSPQGWR